MILTSVIYYQVSVIHIDGFCRGLWFFKKEDDALHVATALKRYYESIIAYRPFVYMKPTIGTVCKDENLIILNDRKLDLSKATSRIDSLMAELRESPNDVLEIIGELQMSKNCCFGMRRIVERPRARNKYSFY